MNSDDLINILSGMFFLIMGIRLLNYNIKKTRSGYRSKYGYDIGMYSSSLILIALGLVLIYRALFH
jgi:hypothetical protein